MSHEKQNKRNSETSHILPFLRRIIVPRDFWSLLGIVLGATSFLALVNHAFDFGISSALRQAIIWYDETLSIVLAPVSAALLPIVIWAFESFGFEIKIGEHWKHIFVLMNVYILRNSFTYKLEGRSNFWVLAFFVFIIITGIIVSVISSAVAGSISNTSYFDNMKILIVSISGFILYDTIERAVVIFIVPDSVNFGEFGMDRAAVVRFYLVRNLERYFYMGGIGFAVCTLVFAAGNPSASGISALISSVLTMSVFWILGRSSIYYEKVGRFTDLPFLERLSTKSGTSKLGFLMLSAFFWGMCLVLANAGFLAAGR